MSTSILEDLLAMETRVWEALVRGDAKTDAALLSPDFLGVYKTGFAGRACHAGQLTDGPTVLTYRIEDAQIMELADGTALLAYLATYTRPDAAEIEEQMYVSSIWRRTCHRWENVFSQDTDREAREE